MGRWGGGEADGVGARGGRGGGRGGEGEKGKGRVWISKISRDSPALRIFFPYIFYFLEGLSSRNTGFFHLHDKDKNSN